MPMNKGFPRPRAKIKEIEKAKRWGLDEDGWNNKEYPIPYSARMNRLSHLAKIRVLECAKNKLCMVCGEFVPGEMVLAYKWADRLTADSGPFHEKCVKLTQSMCPMVNHRPEQFNFELMEWDQIQAGIIVQAKFLSGK